MPGQIGRDVFRQMTCLPCHWPWHGRQSFPHTLSIHNFLHSHFRLNIMRKDNNNDNSSAKTKLAIVHGSMDFFRYLQEHSRDRFSRFEAYLYMLDKACTNYRPQNIDAKWIPAIGDGQFFITKTELAVDWHWHRATVRDFLAKLTEFGCIVIEEHLKGILCTMTRLVVTVNPSVAGEQLTGVRTQSKSISKGFSARCLVVTVIVHRSGFLPAWTVLHHEGSLLMALASGHSATSSQSSLSSVASSSKSISKGFFVR